MMTVYNFFKYTGTETGKSLGVYSTLEKAIKIATEHMNAIYGYDKIITFNQKENYFEIINLAGEKSYDDWHAINEIKVL